MKVIAFIEVTVTVEAVRDYAEKLGWMKIEGKTGTYRGVSMLYRHPDKSRPMLILPTTEKLGDFESVVQNLVKDFAYFGEKTEGEVWKELSSTEPKLA